MFKTDFYDTIYSDIFKHKIRLRKNVYILLVEYVSTLLSFKIFKIERLKDDKLDFIQLVENIDEQSYDYIIFQNQHVFEKHIPNLLSKLKKDGKVMIIANIITKSLQFYYHPFSYLMHLFEEQLYMDDFFRKLKVEYDMNIIDVYRLYSYYIPTYPYEYFLVTMTL